jgi:hypothetical protein
MTDTVNFAAIARDVRETLQRALGPAARACLQSGGFAREEEEAIAAGAEIIWTWRRCDDSAGWAAALSVAAAKYHDALRACEAAAAAMTAVERASENPPKSNMPTYQPHS